MSFISVVEKQVKYSNPPCLLLSMIHNQQSPVDYLSILVQDNEEPLAAIDAMGMTLLEMDKKN